MSEQQDAFKELAHRRGTGEMSGEQAEAFDELRRRGAFKDVASPKSGPSPIVNKLQQLASGLIEGSVHPSVPLSMAGGAMAGLGGAMIGAGIGVAPDILRGLGVPEKYVPDLRAQAVDFLRREKLTAPPDAESRYTRSAGEFAGASMGGGIRGMAGGLVSGLSSQAAKDIFPESSIAPLVGALAPTAVATAVPMAVRGMLRGTPATAEKMRQNIAAQEAVNMPPDAALAQGGRLPGILKYLARAPGGVKVTSGKGKAIQSGLGGFLDEITPKKMEPVAVGSSIQTGIEGFRQSASKSWTKANDAFEKAIPKNTNVPLINTTIALDSIAGKLNDPLFREAFPLPGQLEKLRSAVANKPVLDFSTTNELRRAIGQKASDTNLIADVSKGQWKALYKSINDDIRSSLNVGDKRALELFGRTNKVWDNVNKRIDDIYGPLNNIGTPEAKYFASVRSLNQGATKLTAVRKILPREEFSKLRDTFLNDMGKATPGKQNEYGDLFSSERFLTNWNSLSDAAQTSLVGKHSSLRVDLNQLAKQASEIRKIEQVYQNPSGTGLASGSIATGGLVVGSALSGNFGLAASILGAMGVNWASAKTLTNPKFARFLADSTRIPSEKMPIIINRFIAAMEKEGHSFDKNELEQIRVQHGNKIFHQ